MKLTLAEIKKITVGAVKIWQEQDGFHFAKCTDKQIAAWYAIRDTLGARSEATTGVRLDFHTNSTVFQFGIEQGDKYEIYIDNVLRYVYGPKLLFQTVKSDKCKLKPETKIDKNIVLDGKEHRITLIFPSHTIGVIRDVQIDDDATLIPHIYDYRMLFFGDSITQGWNTRWDSLSFAYGVSRFFNAESVIQGIGGAVFHETTFDEQLAFEPDIVCVAYGTNDWEYNETKEGLRSHVSRYLECLIKRYEGKNIFGISPIWRGDTAEDKSMGSFRECCEIVKDEIKSHGLILIDGEFLMPHVPEFFDDGYLHPNATGFGIYTQNLVMRISKEIL